MTTTATSAARASAPATLAVTGLLFAVYQAWGYLGWLLEDIPLRRDGTGVPDDVRASVVRGEVTIGIGALIWIAVVARTVVKRRSATWTLVLSISWALVYWQESLVNLSDRRFTYNAYFLTRGDWIPNLPFSTADGSMLDQPLLMEALVFLWLIPAVGLGVATLLQLASRWVTSAVALFLIAWLAASLFETAFEFSGISQQLLAWNLVPEHLSLRGGTEHQWPLPEFLLGLVWALPGYLWHVRDRFTSLAWLDPTTGAGGFRAQCLRVLALSGLINAVFLAYNLVLIATPATLDARFPAFLGG